jgi:hypothetical protein
MPFQPMVAPALSGNVTPPVITSAGPDPTVILSVNTAWNIQVSWSVTGFLAATLGGEWRLQAFLESMGIGFEGSVAGPVTVPLAMAPPAATRNYAQNLAVPGNPAIGQGAYKLVLTILHVNGGVPTQMAAFVEGPLLQFIP